MKSFPNPLTPSEEKYYIRKYTEGDLEAKHILIERNLRLVAHVIKKYQNSEEDPEDLISIGTIGLIKAVDEEEVAEKIHLKENIQTLYEKVEKELSQRERIILKMRYGLYNGEEYTQREIARQLGISRSYVSRIEKGAVEKLRKSFS